MSDWNDQIIAEFRENDGRVETAGFGDRLVLLHTIGARSGRERINPVMGLPAGDGWYVAASKGGAPDEPAWAHNLRAHPHIVLEAPPASEADTAITQVRVEAVELTGAQRDDAWAAFLRTSPGFAEYERRTERTIAVFHLVRA